MVGVTRVFRDVCDEKLALAEGVIQLGACYPDATFSNGFTHGVPGHQLVPSLTVQADVRA
jgi:hypothetical protein